MGNLQHSDKNITNTTFQHSLEITLRLFIGHRQIKSGNHPIQILRLAVLNICIQHQSEQRNQQQRILPQDMVGLESVAQEQLVVLAVLAAHSLQLNRLALSHIDHIVGDANTRLLHLRVLSENIPKIDVEEVAFVLHFATHRHSHIDHDVIQVPIADSQEIRDHRIACAASNVRVHHLRVDLLFIRRRRAFLQKRANRLHAGERAAVLHHLQQSLRRATRPTHSPRLPDRQHRVGRETEVQVHVVEQFVHQADHLHHHLVLAHVVAVLHHHLQRQVRALVAVVLALAVALVVPQLGALAAHRVAAVAAVVFLQVSVLSTHKKQSKAKS